MLLATFINMEVKNTKYNGVNFNRRTVNKNTFETSKTFLPVPVKLMTKN